MIKAKLKKVGVVPVRVTVPEGTGAARCAPTRMWQWEGVNYGSLMEIHELPEVRKALKEVNLL